MTRAHSRHCLPASKARRSSIDHFSIGLAGWRAEEGAPDAISGDLGGPRYAARDGRLPDAGRVASAIRCQATGRSDPLTTLKLLPSQPGIGSLGRVGPAEQAGLLLLFEPVALVRDHERVRVVEQAVEGRGSEDLVAETWPHCVTAWFVVMSMLPRS